MFYNYTGLCISPTVTLLTLTLLFPRLGTLSTQWQRSGGGNASDVGVVYVTVDGTVLENQNDEIEILPCYLETDHS